MSATFPAFSSGASARDGFEQQEEAMLFAPARARVDIRFVVSAIRANLWLIGAIIAAILAIALVATMLQAKRYTAYSTIQINDTGGKIFGDKDLNAEDTNVGTYDTDRFLKTQVDVLQSRGLALRVAQKLKLIGNPQFYEAQGVPPPAASTTPELMRDAAIAMLTGNLNVTLPRDSRIVTLSYVSTNPRLSAHIANAYASEFIQSNLQRKFDSSSYARNFLGEQLQEAKIKLEASERAVNTYARSAGLINTGSSTVQGPDGNGRTDRGGTVTASSMQQLNQAGNEATARRIEAEGKWRAVSAGGLLSSPVVQSNPTVVALQSERATVEAQLSQDRANHLDDYPTVKAKQAQLNSINQQLTSVATNVRNSVRQEYQGALSTEMALKGKVEQLKSETLSEQDRSVQYNLLAREADTNRQLYEGLLERYKTLNAVSGVSLSNVSIIDQAEVPKSPSSPHLLKNLLFGLLLGSGLAALSLYLKSQFDDLIRVPEDIEGKLDLALLGVIPRSADSELRGGLEDPKSPISEAYNSLRGSLLYATSEGLPKSILVTSAQASEGKTTTSLAIATGLARMGKRTLLIDADMRRPSVHKQLLLANERGLSTLLTSHEPLTGIAIAAAQERLSVIPAGPVPPSPTELLSTGRLEGILREAASSFDVVVIDSPPILGLADAPVMSALVDGVIFVVEADRAHRGALKTAMRRLRAMRPVLLGAVLTKFDPLRAGNRYSEYYGNKYYQYDSQAADD